MLSKALVTLLLAVLPSTALIAQQFQFIGKAGDGPVNYLCFTSPDIGFAADNYRLWKTTDGGKTWTVNYDFKQEPLLSVFFFNGSFGWVCGGDAPNGFIMRTSDGGAHWQRQQNALKQIYSCYFTTPAKGWAVGNDAMSGYQCRYKTTNGGRSWRLIDTAADYLRNVYFYNKRYGWILGDNSHMFRTTNGGRTWKPYTIAGVMHFFLMQAFSPESLWALDNFNNGQYYTSSDSGRHWTIIRAHASKLLCNLHFTSARTGYAIGAEGLILKTSDGGQHWQELQGFTTEKLKSISFPAPNCGYIGSESGNIYKWVQ